MCLQTCSGRKVYRAGGTTAAVNDDRAWLSEEGRGARNEQTVRQEK